MWKRLIISIGAIVFTFALADLALAGCGCGCGKSGGTGCSPQCAQQHSGDMCDKGNAGQVKAAEAAPVVAVAAVNVGNKICPVMGDKIDDKFKVTYEYEGKIYNFCCPGCIESFKKDPQKYIRKVEEELHPNIRS
jgi:YHS domain-containing protein